MPLDRLSYPFLFGALVPNGELYVLVTHFLYYSSARYVAKLSDTILIRTLAFAKVLGEY